MDKIDPKMKEMCKMMENAGFKHQKLYKWLIMVKWKLSAPKMKIIYSRGASSCQSKVAGKEFV